MTVRKHRRAITKHIHELTPDGALKISKSRKKRYPRWLHLALFGCIFGGYS